MKRLLHFFLMLDLAAPALSLELTENIRLNQIGFYPHGPKTAIVVDAPTGDFYIATPDLADTVYTGVLGAAQVWDYSDESVRQANFTDLEQEGLFVVVVPELGCSHPFEIKEYVHQRVAMWTLKGFYFQRASMELIGEFAGEWKRPAGHPDVKVYVHASAATDARPENTIISGPRGWYDAGDYNKYLVNSGISVYTLLQLYENFPDYCKSLKTFIPESDDAMPDILDEALWNIRWMLTMQDPNDGGVYHKLTCANFQGFVMPHRARAKRWVVQKSTAATLDFTAIMAQSARIFQQFENELPGFADSCLAAALAAWDWARANPKIYYDQGAMNSQYDPDINTGQYRDNHLEDEFAWASMELYIATGKDSFLIAGQPFKDPNTHLPAWPRVATLGYYSLLQHEDELPNDYNKAAVHQRVIGLADWLLEKLGDSAYHVVIGRSQNDFGWGSNGQAANQSVALLTAFRLTGDKKYLHGALSNLDYLLGRNAVGYCFLTGLGDKPPRHIHHRQSGSDGVEAPVPGLLAGGPNQNQNDKNYGVDYPSDLPAKSYVDVQGSWASNEIAINWNAPMAYTACAIEAIMAEDGLAGGTRVQHSRRYRPDFELLYNYPNPFNPTTTIAYMLPKRSWVKVSIYNLQGRHIKTLLNAGQDAGKHSVEWNAAGLSSGVYFYKITAGNFTAMKKCLLVK